MNELISFDNMVKTDVVDPSLLIKSKDFLTCMKISQLITSDL